MFHTVALLLFLLAPLSLPGSGPMQAQSLKDDDFAEFEDEDLEEFDFEVNEIDDEDCEWPQRHQVDLACEMCVLCSHQLLRRERMGKVRMMNLMMKEILTIWMDHW